MYAPLAARGYRRAREHGTRAKYIWDRCRCGPCTEANRRYARELTRQTSAYRIRCVGGGAAWQVERRAPGSRRGRIVERGLRSREKAVAIAAELNRELDLEEPRWASGALIAQARKHLGRLRELGIGGRRVAEIVGMSRTTVADLLEGKRRHGRKDRPRRRRILAATCERLLGIPLDSAAAPRALVDATETWRLVGELLEAGVSKAQIAHATGKKRGALQLGRERVTQRNAAAVAELHRQLLPGRREVAA